MTVPIPSRVSSSPVLNDTIFLDNNGSPLVNGQIYTYEAGGFSTEQTTFADSSGIVANTNPIVLDSSGRMQTGLWLANGFTYNFTLCDQSNVVLESFEDIAGTVAVTAGGGIGTVVWNIPTTVPHFVSSTQFYLVGDYTNEFAHGNRVRWQYNDSTFGYGVVVTTTLSSGNTYVIVLLDGISISSQIVSVAWSALVVDDYTADAGAIGYTSTFTYAGANVGTQIQYLDNQIIQHAKSFPAIYSAGNYSVTVGYNPTVYTNMAIDVIFDTATTSQVTINVNNIGPVNIKQYTYSGALVDPTITVGMCSRLIYNGTYMVLLDQLPYTPPVTPPPTFVVTKGSIAIGGTFTVTAGASGNISVIVSCFVHANYGSFGEGTFTLLQNGTLVNTQWARTLEWDGRTSGCGATLFAATSITPGTTATYQVNYTGPGGAYQPNWSATTA